MRCCSLSDLPLKLLELQDGSKGWNRAYREHVEISIQEAQAVFPSDDLEVLLPVQLLKYKASTELRAADIDRILFGDEIKNWLKEEAEKAAGVWENTDLRPTGGEQQASVT